MASKMTIQKLLFLGFGVAVMGAMIIGGISSLGLSKNINNATAIINSDVPLVRAVDALRNNMLMHRRYEKDYFINIGNAAKQKVYLVKFNEQSEAMDVLLTSFLKLINDAGELGGDERQRAELLKKDFFVYRHGFLEIARLLQADSTIAPQKANALMGSTKDAVHGFEETLTVFQEKFEAMLVATVGDVIATGTATKNTLLLVVICGALGLLALAFFISRHIVASLQRAVHALSWNAEQLASASNSIATGSQSLADGSSEQAASLEETSSAMDELASQARQNSDHSEEANRIMAATDDLIRQASLAMQELTASMAEISKASEETSKIVKTIDEIAFQTNLLALNAAVEAARAGEAGAGFAVVADEVRNLAMRAAEATKSTSGLIETTVTKVGAGAGVVSRTSGVFSQVIKGTSQISALIGDIRTASSEQRVGIAQVAQGISEMSAVVQVVAANSEESASASEEMNGQAEGLRGVVAELSLLVGQEVAGRAEHVYASERYLTSSDWYQESDGI